MTMKLNNYTKLRLHLLTMDKLCQMIGQLLPSEATDEWALMTQEMYQLLIRYQDTPQHEASYMLAIVADAVIDLALGIDEGVGGTIVAAQSEETIREYLDKINIWEGLGNPDERDKQALIKDAMRKLQEAIDAETSK